MQATLSRLNKITSFVLQWFTILLMVVLTVVVIVAVLARLMGQSFVWYDEVAVILLAWITYYGSALAALHRRHIGFDSILLSLQEPLRKLAIIVGELLVIGFFILMAWAGFEVLNVLYGMNLVSLPWVPVHFTQSVIPIGALLFIFCQLLSLPDYWSKTVRGISLEHAEIEEEVEKELQKTKERS
ncbi:TRAP transporter small permease [Roseinatronobacter sp.]|uniref:TRAP transporter small permease n=1 Tax=Roseinatronobacter sp. TaxID=1945755 RepID=UPI0025CEDBAA|nr:TRAP transporter small permease subunit [Rhodobaca sp.]